MSFRHSSSISSEDDFIDPSLIHRDSYIRQINSVNDIVYQSNQTDSEDEIDYSKIHRSRHKRRNDYNSFINHLASDVYQACRVMINYKKDPSDDDDENDEILIKQKQNNDGQTIIVYKGYLKPNETFLFKSQHRSNYPFDIKFYVNGHYKGHLLTCCEYKYRQGGFKIGKLFIIQQIEKTIPCYKCRRNKEEIKFNLKRVLSDDQSLENKESNINDDEQILESIHQNDNKSQQENEDNTNNSPNSENNLSNGFRRMLIERTTNNNDNLFESLLSLLQNGLHRVEIRQPLPPRYQGNVENFIIILLGIEDKTNVINSIVNFVKILNNIEELNSFICTLNFEKVILIVNNLLFESIQDFSPFNSIYILSNNLILENKSSNIRGNFSNLNLIFEQIKEEFLNENNLFSIEFVHQNEKQNQLFSYSQLLKETILIKDNEGNLKKDFIDFCRFHYFNNYDIDQFEKDFTLEKAILWFKKNTFIRKMLNRALRTKEIDILFKMRWIIQTINNQIKENYLSKIVYRIYYISLDEFEKLKEYEGGLISFGTFLNCSLNEPSRIEDKTILFRIETKIGLEFENEIYLPFDNIYHIESIQQSIINLKILDQDNKQFQQLTNELRQEIQSPIVLIQFGKLLISNNDYLHADYFARSLFNDNSLQDNPTLLASLAALHHLLGSVDNKQNNYRAARHQFEESLKIFLTFISEDNQILSATYNNIGSMFYQEDQHEQAIIYHQKAIKCQLKSSSPDLEAIATYSGNIGAVYLDQKKYEESLIHYKRSLKILQQSTPDEESLAIAMVYDRIASVYWRMDKPEDALNFYQKALQLELKYLQENDHKISISYFNISTAYAKLNRLDDAIDSAEKSIQQLLKSVPPDHPEVKENTEQLEGLRRRKWLQQLYQ